MTIQGWSVLIAFSLGVHFFASGDAAGQFAPSIERVSIGDNGEQVFRSDPPSSLDPLTPSEIRVSFDGDRVLFGSHNALVSDDLNSVGDAYLRIRSLQTTQRVTLLPDGSEYVVPQSSPRADLRGLDMSSNGRFVLFSIASGKFINDSGTFELYVRDVESGETELVLTSNSGAFLNAEISDDGNIITFDSNGTDLVANDRNGARTDVFVHDRAEGETTRLRVSGSPGWWPTSNPDMSPDGRYVAFVGFREIYRVDLWTGAYDLVSVLPDPEDRNRYSMEGFFDPAISADGQFVAYFWRAIGITFYRDMNKDRSVTVSVTADGRFAFGAATKPSISADGRFVVFTSTNGGLSPDVSPFRGRYAFLFDADDGSVALVSRNEQGEPFALGAASQEAHISGDGSILVLASTNGNLIAGDTNAVQDVFALSLPLGLCAGRIVTITGSGQIIGTDGADVIRASAGTDSIFAGAGDDLICSGDGDDMVEAGPGDDVIYTGLGDDFIDAGAGRDVIDAGAGEDIVNAGDGDDLVYAGKNDDIVNAGLGDDRVFGGGGTDLIRGNQGLDKLAGGPGNDTVVGGPGDDFLFGGLGTDTCKGSAGRDRYFQCEERRL